MLGPSECHVWLLQLVESHWDPLNCFLLHTSDLPSHGTRQDAWNRKQPHKRDLGHVTGNRSEERKTQRQTIPCDMGHPAAAVVVEDRAEDRGLVQNSEFIRPDSKIRASPFMPWSGRSQWRVWGAKTLGWILNWEIRVPTCLTALRAARREAETPSRLLIFQCHLEWQRTGISEKYLCVKSIRISDVYGTKTEMRESRTPQCGVWVLWQQIQRVQETVGHEWERQDR